MGPYLFLFLPPMSLKFHGDRPPPVSAVCHQFYSQLTGPRSLKGVHEILGRAASENPSFQSHWKHWKCLGQAYPASSWLKFNGEIKYSNGNSIQRQKQKASDC